MGERVGLLLTVYFLTVNTEGLGLGLTGASLCELMLDIARTGDLKLKWTGPPSFESHSKYSLPPSGGAICLSYSARNHSSMISFTLL